MISAFQSTTIGKDDQWSRDNKELKIIISLHDEWWMSDERIQMDLLFAFDEHFLELVYLNIGRYLIFLFFAPLTFFTIYSLK